MEHFASVLRPRGQRPGADLTLTSPGEAERARRFHSGLPGYAPTPLVSLDGLAHSLGVSKIWIKDESKRFGLNAFKALGGSYAMARCLSEKLGKPLEEMSFEELCAPAARRALGDITFVTATDGNHGRGVAWAARLLGQKAVVYMPKGSAAERLENIRAQGAQAEITEYNYDDAVRLANRMAEEHGWILIQDTAWPGYEEIPAHIMQGYTTLAAETLQTAGLEAACTAAEVGCNTFLLEKGETAAGGAGGGEAHPSVSPGGGGQLRRCGAGLLYLRMGGGAAGHRHRGARPGRLPVPHRPGRRRGAALRHRGHGQHDGGSVLRRALHHQLEDHRCLRGCLPVLRGRIRRPGNASAGPAGGGRPGGGVRGVRRSDSRGAGCPDAGRHTDQENYQRIINGED